MRKIILGALIALIALAYFDVQTGFALVDEIIRLVPIDWLKGLV